MGDNGKDLKEILWNRLSSAILKRAYIDFRRYAMLANKHNRNEKVYVSEVKQIIEFIDSAWYDYLTNYNSPKKDIKEKLLSNCDKDIREKIKYLTKPIPFINIAYNQCAIVVDNKKIYDSISECSRKLNIHRRFIYLGLTTGKMVKGHFFKKLLK